MITALPQSTPTPRFIAVAVAIALLAVAAAALASSRLVSAARPRARHIAAAALASGRPPSPQGVLTATAPAADLALTLDAPAAVAPGGTWVLAARVTNVGGGPAAVAAVTLTVPTTVTMLGASPAVSVALGRVVWPLAGLDAGAAVTLTARFRVPADAASGTELSATARAAQDPEGDDANPHAAALTRVRDGDLRAEIATNARDARPTERVTWTVLAANVAPVRAESVTIDVALDGHTRFVTDTMPPGAERTLTGSGVRYALPSLEGPLAWYVDVVAEVEPDAPAGALLAPGAAISSATGVMNVRDDRATASPVPVVVADLWLSALGPLSAPRGGPVAWQLRWGNRAGGRARAVVVTATLPAGVTLIKAVPPATVQGRALSWARESADPEGEAPIEILRIEGEIDPATAARSLRMDAAVRGLGRDAAPTDNDAHALTAVLSGAPARVQLQAPTTIGVGASRTVAATVTDGAGEPVADGTVVAFASTRGTLSTEVAVTTGGSATTVLAVGDAPGSAMVTVRVGGLSATASVEIVAAALRLTSDLAGPRGPAARSQTYPGEALRWSLGVRNGADSTARDVRLTTVLPDALVVEGVAATAPITSVGVALPNGANIERAWRLGDLAPGAALTVTLSPRVETNAPWTGVDLLFARAEVTTSTAVASARDLERTEQLRIFASDLRVAVHLDAGASTLRPGGFAVYDIHFSNGQPQTVVSGAVLTGTLPTGTRFDHWQADVGTSVRERRPFEASSRTLSWAIDQSMAGPGAVRLWLRIDGDAAAASELRMDVAIGSPVPDLDPSNDARSASAFLAGIDLRTVISAPPEAEPGAVVAVTIDVLNNAPNDSATLVTLNAELPPGAVLVRAGDPGQVVAPGRVRWDFERLSAGASRRVGLELRLPADAAIGTALTLHVDALAAEREATPVDNVSLWTVRLSPGPPSALRVRARDSQIPACALGMTVLSSTVSDSVGRPVKDGTAVTWQTTTGRLESPGSVTAGGVATATLLGAPPLGPATVTAHAGPAFGRTVVDLIAGAPAGLAVSASPGRTDVGGVSDVVAHALDGCGNAVADGWPVTFTAERGAFAGGGRSAIVATIGGAARARLFVGDGVGSLRIRADQGSVHGETVIDVTAPTATPVPTAAPRFRVWLPLAVRPRATVR